MILDNKDIEEKVLNSIENGANKKDIQKLLTTEQLSFNIKQEKETFEKDINFSSISNEIFDKWENLDSRKKKKVETLFVKIKKIINS